jgi:hypothetical protein
VEEIEKATAEAKRIKLARMATLFFDTFPQYHQQQQQQQQILLTAPTVEQQQATTGPEGAMSIGILPRVELPLVISVTSA